ncbi:class I SAM-dependent methyltransferase [Georgenia sp. EYE_87]|uniref:class I SAM-dependent methyltransferase n=1 Tax=Georgenia sp. EYE_87 TaxID=2853448 RepID=UPI002002D7D8|nr:class I SAM-dependent methyltransferase [Georgenia sp. EYE_87]MCK6211772.1 class I SAM-dependent methyltransferase [Georgenia sp. EYE_87]
MRKDLSVAGQAQIVEAVGERRTVLDVGRTLGPEALILAERGCAVTAISTDPRVDGEPASYLARTVVAQDRPFDPAAVLDENDMFDVVVLGEELARSEDPVALLRAVQPHLRPDGELILSAPNLTHGSVRLAALAGRWDPARGPVRNHFALGTLARLVQEAGLEVAAVRATVADALATPYDVPDDVPSVSVQWVRNQPEAAYFHYVLSARRPASGPVPRTEIPEVLADGAVQPVQDHHAEAVARAEARTDDLRHRVLTQRDHIIGLEATAARATAELARVRREAEQEIAELRATTTWRAGRLAVAPVAKVRSLLGGRP